MGNLFAHRNRCQEDSAPEPSDALAASQEAAAEESSDSLAATQIDNTVFFNACVAADEEFVESDEEDLHRSRSEFVSNPPAGGPWSAGGLEIFASFDSGNCAGVIETNFAKDKADYMAADVPLQEAGTAKVNDPGIVASKPLGNEALQGIPVAREPPADTSATASQSERHQLADESAAEPPAAGEETRNQVAAQPSTGSLAAHSAPDAQPACQLAGESQEAGKPTCEQQVEAAPASQTLPESQAVKLPDKPVRDSPTAEREHYEQHAISQAGLPVVDSLAESSIADDSLLADRPAAGSYNADRHPCEQPAESQAAVESVDTQVAEDPTANSIARAAVGEHSTGQSVTECQALGKTSCDASLPESQTIERTTHELNLVETQAVTEPLAQAVPGLNSTTSPAGEGNLSADPLATVCPTASAGNQPSEQAAEPQALEKQLAEQPDYKRTTVAVLSSGESFAEFRSPGKSSCDKPVLESQAEERTLHEPDVVKTQAVKEPLADVPVVESHAQSPAGEGCHKKDAGTQAVKEPLVQPPAVECPAESQKGEDGLLIERPATDSLTTETNTHERAIDQSTAEAQAVQTPRHDQPLQNSQATGKAEADDIPSESHTDQPKESEAVGMLPSEQHAEPQASTTVGPDECQATPTTAPQSTGTVVENQKQSDQGPVASGGKKAPGSKAKAAARKKRVEQPQQNERCFDIWLRADCAETPYARKDCQWFYFGIRGRVDSGDKFKFRVLGMSRFKETKCIAKGRLLTDGMRPVVQSIPSNPRWLFTNGDVGVQVLPDGEMAFLFEHTVRIATKPEEEIYFAVTFPYPLQKIRDSWAALRKSLVSKNIYVHQEHLCDSLGCRPIELWTITNSSGAARRRQPKLEHMLSTSKRPKIFPGRRAVFISARVHPGETPASYTLDGLLEFLASDTPAARVLLDRYVFHVIPVLNPDGVELGHHRTDLHGENLNRVYSKATLEEHPSVCAAMAACMSAHCFQGGLRMYLDLHAHSNRRGLFLLSDKAGNREEQKLYGMALGRRCNYFEYAQSDFFSETDSAVENTGTGKNEISQRTGSALCFTVESNYCRGHHSTQVFQPPLWKAWGKSLLEALLDMDALENPDPLSVLVDSSAKSREIMLDLMKVADFMAVNESAWQCPEVYPNRPSRAHPQFALVKRPTDKHTPSQILFRHPELISQEVEVVESEPEIVNHCTILKFRLHENYGGLWLPAADLEFRDSQCGTFFYGVISSAAVTAEASPDSDKLCQLPLGTVVQVSERCLVGGSLQLRVAVDSGSRGKAYGGWVSEYKAVAVDPKLGGKVQLMRLKGPPATCKRPRGHLYYAFPL